MSEVNEFKLERYKYILKEIHFLNENMHKYLTFIQGISTIILGGVVAIFVNWKKLGVDAEIAQTGIYVLLGLLCLFSAFVVLYIVSGILSWLDYRKEEAALLDEVISPGYRSKPTIKNLWRWHETWLVVSIFAFVVTVSIAVHYVMIPLVR